MSAPISPGDLISAQRDRLGHHRDQQRALGMRRLGDRRQVGDAAEDVGILDDDRAGLAVDRRDQPLGVGLGGQLAAAPCRARRR